MTTLWVRLAVMALEVTSPDSGAPSEAVVCRNHFNELPDPRQRGNFICPLDEILMLALLAVLAGTDSFVEIARFGLKNRELLRRSRPVLDGTPSHDHLGDVFAALDAAFFQRCFVARVALLIGMPAVWRRSMARPRSGPAEKRARAPSRWSPLSSRACLREAASAKAGQRVLSLRAQPCLGTDAPYKLKATGAS
jgi:DDE_Tnp_1-associated